MTKSTLYDIIFDKASSIIKAQNPCGVHKDEDGKLKCLYRIDWCCEGCKHLTPTGCGVKALSCRLWLCSAARHKAGNAEVVIALDTLRSVGKAMGLKTGITYEDGLRASKDESLAIRSK